MFSKLAQELGANGLHVNQPIVCDHCEDDDKEAFPYGVRDANGKFWNHLCNDCFDALNCSYDDIIDGTPCTECNGEGVIITCCDDMCVGQGWCMHGDGEDVCPMCDGSGVLYSWMQEAEVAA